MRAATTSSCTKEAPFETRTLEVALQETCLCSPCFFSTLSDEALDATQRYHHSFNSESTSASTFVLQKTSLYEVGMNEYDYIKILPTHVFV